MEDAKERMKLTGMHNGAVEKTIDFQKMWAIVRKNWMVLKSDKIRLIPLMLFPIIMIVIFGFATGSMPKHISAAIVDYDNTAFSHSIAQQLSAMDTFSIKYNVGTQDEGKRLMDRGLIRVLVILPHGLSDDVAAGRPTELQVMVDESDSSVAQLAKSTVQIYAQQLSAQITAQRLDAISALAESANGDLSSAGKIQPSASDRLAGATSQNDVAAHWADAQYVFARSNAGIGATILGLQNSLGYLVDQNEIVSSFSPASVSTATLSLLATGDSQQSVLQSIGSYQGIRGAQAKIMSDAAGIYANYMKLSGREERQEKAALVSAKLVSSAGGKISSISQRAQQANAPITVETLEPYGYGRKGIDFLLPAILATIIFQGATMGLGRAIAGERKDGSLTRVFLTPTSNVTIILGTQVFYLLLEIVRSTFIIFVAVMLFGVSITGNVLDIVALIAIYAFGCTGIGMVLSVITKNQEQYMAVGMLISLPTMFLSGVFFPIQTMPPFLQAFAGYLPVTYAADALRGVMVKGFPLGLLMPDIFALFIFGAFTLTLSLLLFKRELV